MLTTSWLKTLLVAAVAITAIAHDATVDERATQIVDAFTDDEIIGQMTQVNIDAILGPDGKLDENRLLSFAKLKVGSYLNSPFAGGPRNGKYGWTAQEWRDVVTRIQNVSMAENGGHPIIYGIDSVHGANYVYNATLFGQQINAGASFNETLVYQMGQITGRDSIAAGLPWVFGPILEISQNKLWARTYETFGEDPYLVSVMGAQIIKGLQSNPNVAACMKHFVGYSRTPTGHDRDAVAMSDFDLLNYFAPPFIAAVQAGVKTAMENYVSINGVPTVASSKILKDLIRHDLNFQGLVVTDWAEINNLFTFHRVAKSLSEAVRMSLSRTSIDMSMVPDNADFITYTKQMLAQNPEYRDRLKESARRIIKTKLELGLYESPVPGADAVAKLGQAEDRNVALNLARESIVLLQNKDKALPISQTSSVFLTGHSANDIGNLLGGWSQEWQGRSGNDQFPYGTTVKKGMEDIAGQRVTFFNGLKGNGSFTQADLETAKSLAGSMAYTVAVIGETPYTEKPGDINDLALPAGQIEYVKQLASMNTKVIVVLVGGRPRLLGDLPSKVHAVINAMLPGPAGGQAIAEIIYGIVNPSGRLPITYPKDPANVAIPYNHLVTTQCSSGYCQMQWDFGTGLSYTEFDYRGLKLSKSTVSGSSDSLTVSVTVTNKGSIAGKETVMLFLTQPFRSISVPEVKMLKKFQKIELGPGRSTTVTFTLDSSDWSVYDPQIGNGFLRMAENGDFIVSIKPETKCDVYGSSLGSDLCARFTLQDSVTPFSLTEDNGAGTVVAFGETRV